MAAFSVNNIAATFVAAGAKASSSSSSSASLATWNPHASLPRSLRSSLLRLYGPPGPLPASRGPHLPFRGPRPNSPLPIVGSRLPDATLSYLDGAQVPTVIRTVSLRELTRGGKSVILSATAAFAPVPLSGGAHLLARKAPLMRRARVVACVVANDVYVMRAWGESLGAAAAGVMMLSDPDAELAIAMGTATATAAAGGGGGAHGLGVRSESFCMVVEDGVVRAVFDGRRCGWDFDDVIRAL